LLQVTRKGDIILNGCLNNPGRPGSVPGSESALVITEPQAGQKEAPDFGVRGSHEKNGKIAFGQ